MERSSSQLISGMDGIGLDGWFSKVKGSLRAPSVLIMLRQVLKIYQWLICQPQADNMWKKEERKPECFRTRSLKTLS